MKRYKKTLALILAMILCIGLLAGCGGDSNTQDSNKEGESPETSDDSAKTPSDSDESDTSEGPDTSKEVNLIYYLWGSEGPANADILEEINANLKEDINATLEIKYIDWGDVATKYPLLFASGEEFDMSHASPNAPVSYFTLAAQSALVDITDMLDTAAPVLKAAIPENTWEGTKFNDKIYGVPSLYTEFTPYGFVYRRDLKEKYGVDEINSIETLEKYMDGVVENETFAPLNGDSNDAQNLYRMMVDLTDQWIEAPGIPLDELHLVATSPEEYKDLIHPAFTQEFEDWAVMMHEWSEKGYWPKDILSSQQGGKPNFNNGVSGGFIAHMADWTGNHGALKETMPDVETDFWCFAENNGKIKRKMGVENSTVISANSKNPERALMAIEKFMTDEKYYHLIQYGIEGRQYEVVDGLAKKPDDFDDEVDGGGFSAWALRNDEFNIPYATEDPRRYELNEKWENDAINNPYMGFSFDDNDVSTELSSIANVNSQLGIQIMLGKTQDPKQAVEQYREQLKQAGVEKVIEQVKSQLEEFTPVE